MEHATRHFDADLIIVGASFAGAACAIAAAQRAAVRSLGRHAQIEARELFRQALTWLEPATANRLLSELRSDGLVVEVDRYGQPDRAPAWRLSDEGHLVATVCAVLAAPATAPERTVKVLAAAMALARAAGVDERAAFAPFVAATAVLERDLAALHRLIDRGEDDALAAAAEVAGVHLADLGELARQVALSLIHI